MGTRKYTINENFFNEINTQEKAYFLGFLYGDGSVYKPINGYSYYISIGLNIKDIEILKKFNNLLNSNRPIYINYNKSMCNLCFSSNIMANDLKKLGCVPKKTKILVFPNNNQVPSHLIRHFIRGIFDADGSIWNGKRKKMIIKDKTRKEGSRQRIIHNVKFNITGTLNIMTNIRDYFSKELSFNKNIINSSKNIENCVQLEYSGRKQIKKIYDLLYLESTIHLNRKKEIFEEIELRANIE